MRLAMACGVLIVLSGCALPQPSPGANPCVAPTSQYPGPRHSGNGTVEVLTSPAPLVPGSAKDFTFRFNNPDCAPYSYYKGFCARAPIEVGEDPLLIELAGDDGTRFQTNFLFMHSCPMPDGKWVDGHSVTTFTGAWDGSVMLYDHAAAEAGVPYEMKKMFFAPGNWPVRYGFSYGSYDVDVVANVTIAATALNQASLLQRGKCRDFSDWAPTFRDVAVSVSSTRAKIGTPVDIRIDYTMDVAAGCYILSSPPQIAAQSGNRTWQFGIGQECGGYHDPFLYILWAPTGSVTGHLRATWDGVDATSLKCKRGASPGMVSVYFSARKGTGQVGSHGPNATFEWVA